MKRLDSISIPENERAALACASESLREQLPVTRVILFGSKARGQADEYSDIDLLVLTSCPVTTDMRRRVSETIADINLRHDTCITAIVVSEEEWSEGLISHTLIHSEVERDGCRI